MVALVALLCTTAVWGATFVIVKEAIATVPTFQFLTIRFGIAAVALAVINHRTTRLESVRPGVLIGVALALGYALQTVGLETTTATNAAFVTGLFVVFTPLLAAALTRVAPTGWAIVGVALSALGMGLLTLDGWPPTPRSGDLLVLGCAFAFAVHIIALGRWSGPHDPRGLATWQVGVAAVLFGLISIKDTWQPVTTDVWAAVLLTAVAGTAFAFSAQTWAQARLTPTRTAIILATEPVFGGAYAWFAAGERLRPAGWVGAAAILAAILVSELGTRTGVPPPTPGEGG